MSTGDGDRPEKAGRGKSGPVKPEPAKVAESPMGVVTPLRPKRKCPECGRPSDRATFPFCSPRCKSVDLNRWLSGAYVIAGRDDDISTPSDEDEH